MSIKIASYNITNEKDADVVHFETNVEQIQVLDSKKEIVGNLGDLLMKGKMVTSGHFSDLKISGTYGLKGVTGLPKDVPLDKIHILSISAQGATIGNPTFAVYQLMTQEGKIYNNVVVGKKEGGWTSGGKIVDEKITTILKELGDLTSLKTAEKTSVVKSVNELYTNLAAETKKLKDLTEKFNSHNHDDRYVKRVGGIINGEMTIKNNVAVSGERANGAKVNVLKVDGADTLQVGAKGVELHVFGGENPLYNGQKIWTAATDGAGSGMDADLLAGVKSDKYARLDKKNTFSDTVTFSKNIKSGEYLFVNGGSIDVDKTGRMIFGNKNGRMLAFETNGRVSIDNHIKANATRNEAGMRLAISDKEFADSNGMGFYRNPDTKYLGFYNWTKQKRLGYFSHIDDSLHVDENIVIQGRSIYLQSAMPTGKDRAVGSIWIS